MNKILAQIDKLIERIPMHIRDLIKKAFFFIIGLIALVAIITGIRRGIDNATPGGAKLFQKNDDFFYIDRIKEENKKKNRLIEDVEVYRDLFESRDERIHPTFRVLGRDTEDRLIGEKEEFIKKPDALRQKDENNLIDGEASMEYEKPLPDNLKINKTSEEIPLIESDKNGDRIKSGADKLADEPEVRNLREDKKPDANGMDFIE